MQEQPNIQEQSHIVNHEIDSRYMDPKSDFAFKHFFGKEPHKDLLIKFLNSLFKGRKVIIDIQYNHLEHKGMLKTYQKTVFDLYCTGDKGEKLEIPPDRYVHDVRLIEVNTNQQFYHKLGYIFVEVPKFEKNEDELETDQDYWLYMLKNLHCFDEIPVALSEKEEFVKFFEIAEVSNLNQEDMNAYQQNLKILRDDYSDRQTTLNRLNKLNREIVEGKAKGHAEGLTEGEHKKAAEMALEMKNDGEPISKIIQYTKLTIEEIETL